MASGSQIPASSPADHNSEPPSQKLRSSCNNCAQSKVRCKKEHPKCYRCERLGLNCFYGRSRRRGKPPSKPVSTQQWPQSLGERPSFPEGATEDLQMPWQLDTAHLPADIAPLRERERPDSNAFHSSGIWNIFPPFSDLNFSDDTTAQESTAAFGNNEPTCETPTSDEDMELANIGENTAACCMNTALFTLSSIYKLSKDSSETLTSHSSSETTTSTLCASSDVIILSTRNATLTLARLLACTCCNCVNDSGMPFLLASIAAKILYWYQALYQWDICNPEPQKSSCVREERSSSSFITSGSQKQHEVSTTPLVIGTLYIPHATEKRMKAQMLLCELLPFAESCKMFGTRSQSLDRAHRESLMCKMFENYLQNGVVDLQRSLNTICG